MNKQVKIFLILIFVIAGVAILLFVFYKPVPEAVKNSQLTPTGTESKARIDIEKEEPNPMAIEALREREFRGGDFQIEEELPNGSNYRQYVASYQSEGLKIYGLLTVPFGQKPEGGWPAIVFVHGYIPPKQYSTTGNYPTYQATLARAGFVTFKPDLRGHGNSEGEAVGAHFSEKYLVDTLHATAYLKKYSEVNPERIGYWGHSNGGEIGLRMAVISPDIKA